MGRFNRSKLREDFNYNIWSKILNRFVSPKSGKVDYRRLLKKKHLLEEHVAMLAVFGPQSTPSLFTQTNEKIAYWINAYNALVIFGICAYFPIDSVTNIKTGWLCCSSRDFRLYKNKKKKKRKSGKNHRQKQLFANGLNFKFDKDNQLLIGNKDNNAQTFIFMKDSNDEKKQRHKQQLSKKDKLRCIVSQYWFFEALRFEVDGSLYSLREIERDIICSKFGDSDARILCCLSKGCIGSPKLLNAPYLASTLDAQLNAMNRAFCSGINKDKDLCLRNSNVCISSLFRIYEEHYIKYAIEKKWQITPTNEEDKYDDNVNGALLGYVYH